MVAVRGEKLTFCDATTSEQCDRSSNGKRESPQPDVTMTISLADEQNVSSAIEDKSPLPLNNDHIRNHSEIQSNISNVGDTGWLVLKIAMV